MAYHINKVHGVGPTHQTKLKSAQVMDSERLIKVGSTPARRKRLSVDTGIPEEQLAGWVSQSELMRLPGVGPSYASLLHRSGVQSLRQLARRNPETLHQQIVDTARHRDTPAAPSRETLRRWIADAGVLA